MKLFLPLKQEYQDILEKIYSFAKKNNVELFLVGGFLRDLLLNRQKENTDIDFCLKKGAINFGQKLAKEFKAGFVVLDRGHGACRLVKKIKGRACTLDFTDFRGKTLKDDLLHRDFTINSLAMELENAVNYYLHNLLIDPCGGRKDLGLRIIRAANKDAFIEDPLRVLRAFSFSAILGFKIEEQTEKLARKARKKLSTVSYERIRDELFKIFGVINSYNYIVAMDKLGIFREVIPEIEMMRNVKQGPYHHLDVWQHSLETLRQLEILLIELKDKREIQDYLNEVISSDRKRRWLIKLAAILHDIGKPRALFREDGKLKFYGHERIGWEIAEVIVKRLKLSNEELNSLGKMVLWHLRPGFLADNEEVTPRAAFRYFRDTAGEGVSTLLLSIADQRATKGRLTTRESKARHERVVFSLVKEYFRKKKDKKLPRLVNGDDLMKRFKLEPSPLIGKVLKEIEELQAIGEIKTKSQAQEAAKKLIKKLR